MDMMNSHTIQILTGYEGPNGIYMTEGGIWFFPMAQPEGNIKLSFPGK